MLKYAQDLAKIHKVKLDYSEESIKSVEKILYDVQNEAKHDNSDNSEAIMGIALALDAYIIEMTDRLIGKGEWLHDESQTDVRRRYPYVNRGIVILPVAWCSDALALGKIEHVANTYKQYIEALKEQKN